MTATSSPTKREGNWFKNARGFERGEEVPGREDLDPDFEIEIELNVEILKALGLKDFQHAPTDDSANKLRIVAWADDSEGRKVVISGSKNLSIDHSYEYEDILEVTEATDIIRSLVERERQKKLTARKNREYKKNLAAIVSDDRRFHGEHVQLFMTALEATADMNKKYTTAIVAVVLEVFSRERASSGKLRDGLEELEKALKAL
ncbi:MAG: hypothetical protein WCT28_03535 [Patescibacteria group bacterium]|jgi:hypothetical protein